jgi:hypothetical protein
MTLTGRGVIGSDTLPNPASTPGVTGRL